MAAKSLHITRWLRTGNDDLNRKELDIETIDDLLGAAGRALDKACSSEILGEVVFQTEDGVWRIGSVEFIIEEADPGYLQELLDEEAV